MAPKAVQSAKTNLMQHGHSPAWQDYTQDSANRSSQNDVTLDAISLFEANGMSLNAATICVALARFLWEQGKSDNAEAMLRMNVVYLVEHWGTGNRYVLDAEEELLHFQNTGQMIEAHLHHWCRACNVDDFGIGFDFEDSDRAER